MRAFGSRSLVAIGWSEKVVRRVMARSSLALGILGGRSDSVAMCCVVWLESVSCEWKASL